MTEAETLIGRHIVYLMGSHSLSLRAGRDHIRLLTEQSCANEASHHWLVKLLWVQGVSSVWPLYCCWVHICLTSLFTQNTQKRRRGRKKELCCTFKVHDLLSNDLRARYLKNTICAIQRRGIKINGFSWLRVKGGLMSHGGDLNVWKFFDTLPPRSKIYGPFPGMCLWLTYNWQNVVEMKLYDRRC